MPTIPENATVILNFHYNGVLSTVLQARDDVPGNPLQIPGGWLKPSEPLEFAIQREMIEEVGLSLSVVYGLPLLDDLFLHPKGKNLCKVHLVETSIPYAVAQKLDEWKREGARIELHPLDTKLLDLNLYYPDRRWVEAYLIRRDEMRKTSKILRLPGLSDFPEETRTRLVPLVNISL